MKPETMIKRFEAIIPAVFRAEDELHEAWLGRLAEAKFMQPEQRAELARDYVHALAEHIVKEGMS